MKVPEPEESVGLNPAPIPHVEFSAPPPQAFGTPIAEAAQRIGAEASQGGAQLMDRVIEHKQMADEQKAYSASTDYAQGLQGLLHNTDPATGQPVVNPKTGVPQGILDREGAQAAGGVVDFDTQAQQLQQKYLNTLQTPRERALFMRMASWHAGAAREAAISHVAQQGQIAYNESVRGSLDSLAQSATDITDPKMISGMVDTAYGISTTAAVHNGITDANFANIQRQGAAASIVQKPIEAQLANGSWKAANAILDATKDRLPPQFVQRMQSAISGRALDDTQQSVWETLNEAPSLRMQDGRTFDLQKAGNLILDPGQMKLTNPATGQPLNEQERRQVYTFVKGMAGQQAHAMQQAQNVGNAKYLNDIVNMRAQGGGLQDALKLAANPVYALDGAGVLKAQESAYKLFSAQNVKSDPGTLLELHDGLNDGSITNVAPIQDAFTKGLISKSDYVSMTNLIQKGETAPIKDEWKQIAADVSTKISDKKQQSAFMASLLQQQMEQHITDRASLQSLYLQNMKTVPTGTPGFFRVFGQKTAPYREIAEQLQQNQPFIAALGGTKEAVQFAQRFGGPEVFTPGSQQSLAVMALLKRGVSPDRILPESLTAVIEKHPDWLTEGNK